MLIKRNHRFAIKELPHFAYCKFIFHEDKRSLKVLHWKEGELWYKLSFFFSPVTIKTSIFNHTLLLRAGVELKVYVSFVVHETDRKPGKQTLCLKLSISLCVWMKNRSTISFHIYPSCPEHMPRILIVFPTFNPRGSFEVNGII